MSFPVSPSPAQFPVSPSPAQFPEAIADISRRSANFSPSVWGEHFLSYAPMEVDTELEIRALGLKEEVKRMLMAPVKRASQKLDLIDHMQRLGISYHFENEIEEILQQVHSDWDDDDSHTAALRFRLLRQQGYNVPSDIFNKFKVNGERQRKESLVNDAVGLLSLYEATHLRVHGEEILDEALTFTTTHLESVAHCLSPTLSKQVTHALYQPLRKGLPRVEAIYYISTYEERDSHNETFLTFAKLDFNLVQQLHQKELSEITRWWKDLDFKNKLPFARDRVVECYFNWTLAAYFEPENSIARIMLCKVVAMVSVCDDIYDVHGTLEELEHFTEAIERSDILAMSALPEYMKVCYKALLDVYGEFEEKLSNDGKLYRIAYAKEAVKKLVRAYLQEAKWFYQKYMPTFEEYMSVALVTAGYSSLITISFLGMGDIVTKESFDWILTNPKIIEASSVICRLMDDMAGHKFEEERGHSPSAVECYMNEYSATEEEAKIELCRRVDNAWKDMNEEFLYPTTVPMPLLMQVLNLTRTIDVLYKHEDSYTHPGTLLKDYISSILVKPVSI